MKLFHGDWTRDKRPEKRANNRNSSDEFCRCRVFFAHNFVAHHDAVEKLKLGHKRRQREAYLRKKATTLREDSWRSKTWKLAYTAEVNN